MAEGSASNAAILQVFGALEGSNRDRRRTATSTVAIAGDRGGRTPFFGTVAEFVMMCRTERRRRAEMRRSRCGA